MEIMEVESIRPAQIPSLWPETENIVDDIDPFYCHISGDTIRQKLRFMFSNGLIKKDERLWWAPNENLKVKTLKFLYAAMLGFKEENLSYLYPSGEMGDTLDELWLTKAQKVTEEPKVRDRCCGHVFEKGETYYRCKYFRIFVVAKIDNAVPTLQLSYARNVSTHKTTPAILSLCWSEMAPVVAAIAEIRKHSILGRLDVGSTSSQPPNIKKSLLFLPISGNLSKKPCRRP
jgi:hypothetical protein